jgi:hypothetical protein
VRISMVLSRPIRGRGRRGSGTASSARAGRGARIDPSRRRPFGGFPSRQVIVRPALAHRPRSAAREPGRTLRQGQGTPPSGSVPPAFFSSGDPPAFGFPPVRSSAQTAALSHVLRGGPTGFHPGSSPTPFACPMTRTAPIGKPRKGCTLPLGTGTSRKTNARVTLSVRSIAGIRPRGSVTPMVRDRLDGSVAIYIGIRSVLQ